MTNKTGTKVDVAYKMRPEYQAYTLVKFEEYLELMREYTKTRQARASRDALAVAGWKQQYPTPPNNHRGEPRWEGSKAEQFLKQDMDKDKHKLMKPIDLCHSRPEYQAYNTKTFSSHIDQEIRARKFKVFLYDKNEKKKAAFKKRDD